MIMNNILTSFIDDTYNDLNKDKQIRDLLDLFFLDKIHKSKVS